jgi:hypothetical protein
MSATTTKKFKVGDLVVVNDMYSRREDRGVVYRVTKVLPVNIVAERANGPGRSIRGNPDLFDLAPDSTTQRTDAGFATVESVEYLPPLACGQIVTIAGAGWREPADRLYVVLRESADAKVRVARLGGDNGRYWPSVPRQLCTVVEFSRITVA